MNGNGNANLMYLITAAFMFLMSGLLLLDWVGWSAVVAAAAVLLLAFGWIWMRWLRLRTQLEGNVILNSAVSTLDQIVEGRRYLGAQTQVVIAARATGCEDRWTSRCAKPNPGSGSIWCFPSIGYGGRVHRSICKCVL